MSPSTNGRKVLAIGTTVCGGLLVGAVAAQAGSPSATLEVASTGLPSTPVEVTAPYRPLAASAPVTVEVTTESSSTSTATTAARAESTTTETTAAPAQAAAVEATTATTAAPTTTTQPPTTTTPPTTAAPVPTLDAGPPPSPDPAPETTTTTAPPTTTTQPAPDPSTMSVEDAIRAWFPDRYQAAYNVAKCESGLNPRAVSPGGGNHGLFQINSVHRSDFTRVTGQPWSSVYNAYYNSQYARTLYNQSGWSAWACRP